MILYVVGVIPTMYALIPLGPDEVERFPLGSVKRAHEWVPMPVYEDSSSEIREVLTKGDFYDIQGRVACNERARTVLSTLLTEEDAEFLPLSCDGETFYIMNVVRVADCLDKPNCEFEYFPSGNLKRITRIAFKMECVQDQHCFRIPERKAGATYVSETFESLVRENDLQGLRFWKVWEG